MAAMSQVLLHAAEYFMSCFNLSHVFVEQCKVGCILQHNLQTLLCGVASHSANAEIQ